MKCKELEEILNRILLLDHPDLGVYVIDLENYYYANETLLKMFNYKAEELIGKKGPLDLTHPEDQVRVKENILARLSGEKETIRYEFQAIRKDGGFLWCESFGRRVMLKEKPVIAGVLIDITERKQIEEAMSSLVRFQEHMLDTAVIWIDMLDEEGNVIFWNRAAELISGYTKKEVLGHKKIWEWLYPAPSYRAEIFEKAMNIIRGGERVVNFETTITTKSGEKRIILWYSNNLKNQKGEPVGSIAIGADITERKELEKKINEITSDYKDLLNCLSDAICITDLKTLKVINCNEKFLKLTGIKKRELTDTAITEILPLHLKKKTEELLKSKKSKISFESKLTTGKGEEIPVDITFNKTRCNNKNILTLYIRELKD